VRIEAVDGDITREAVDAIVNAANPSLLGGGGVDGAIHAAAGPALLDECRMVRRTTHVEGLAVGDAVATGAGALPARHVVHTAGPDRRAGQTDPALLASCFSRSLEVAAGLGAGSVAMPAVGAGIYGWDVQEVAAVAVAAVRETAGAGRAPGVELVRFVLFGPEAHAAFREALATPH
jgi:O-acetyl-ADP-ribose deacetylase (regulator of RNase III)